MEEAKSIADLYLNSPAPFSDTVAALNDLPDVSHGDDAVFERFALQVQSLMGLLKTLGPEGGAGLKCHSHVAHLLSKLPPERRSDFRRYVSKTRDHYALEDFAEYRNLESVLLQATTVRVSQIEHES